MNYWPRWISAIKKRTATLSLAQMGAYDRLLDHYYAEDGPLPGTLLECCRIAGAIDKSERDAVQFVLDRFFVLTEAGYTNERADEEIAIALPKIEAARQNGSKGGRPPGSAKKPTGFPPGNPPDTPEEPASKHPHPQRSSPSSKTVSKASPSHPPCRGDRFTDFWLAWPRSERKQDKAECLKRWKAKGLDAIADDILADVRTKRGTTKWTEGYIEAPLVYLNNRRWEDGVVPDEPADVHRLTPQEPDWRREQRERTEEFAGRAAAGRSTPTQTAEVFDVTARLVG